MNAELRELARMEPISFNPSNPINHSWVVIQFIRKISLGTKWARTGWRIHQPPKLKSSIFKCCGNRTSTNVL